MIEQKCCSLKNVEFYDTSKMPTLSGLKEITWLGEKRVNKETFIKLINNNPKLEYLYIKGIKSDWLGIMDGRLNVLKSLTIWSVRFVEDLRKIRLRSLEALSIKDSRGCTRMLIWSMNRNAIKELKLDYSDKLSDGLIRQICPLKTHLFHFDYTIACFRIRKANCKNWVLNYHI